MDTRQTDRLTDRLTDKIKDRLTDRVTDRLTERVTVIQSDWPIERERRTWLDSAAQEYIYFKGFATPPSKDFFWSFSMVQRYTYPSFSDFKVRKNCKIETYCIYIILSFEFIITADDDDDLC